MKLHRETCRGVFGIDRYFTWGASAVNGRLQVIDGGSAKTEREAEEQAAEYLTANPNGVVYVLKALSILTVKQ